MAERSRFQDAEARAESVSAEQPAAQPLTAEERRKKKFETVVAVETDDQRATRHNAEQQRLGAAHQESLLLANKQYPVPGKKFDQLTVAEQANWNSRRVSIDQANKAFHRQVKELMAEYVLEDQFLAQKRADAAKS